MFRPAADESENGSFAGTSTTVDHHAGRMHIEANVDGRIVDEAVEQKFIIRFRGDAANRHSLPQNNGVGALGLLRHHSLCGRPPPSQFPPPEWNLTLVAS